MDDLHNTTDAKRRDEGADPAGEVPQENLSIHSTIKAPVRRGGRGRKASPELTRAVHDVRASEERIKHDITRLNGDKERLVEQVNDLEERLAAAKKEGLLKSTIKRLEALLTEAHDKLSILEGVLPEQSISRDRALMEEVLKKWHEYDRERTNQAHAESRINKTPEDKRAEGDFNRARAAAHALKEEIGSLVKQGELIVENSTQSPVRDEWVSYTREQAKMEIEEFAKKHPQNAELADIPLEEGAKIMEETAEKIVPEIIIPEETLPAQETTEKKATDAIPQSPMMDIHPATIDLDTHPLVTDEVTTEEPKIINDDYITKAEVGDAAWNITQQQTEELYKKNFGIQPEEQTPLIVPEEAGVETNIEFPVAEEVAKIEPPEAIESETKEEPVAPTDPQTLAYAEKQIHNHINTLFEKKRFLGFGAIQGTDSLDWKDPQVGFVNKTVSEILGTRMESFPKDGKKHFGIEDFAATDKMQKYLQLALQETGVEPLPEEKVGGYLTRASSIAIGKFLKKG